MDTLEMLAYLYEEDIIDDNLNIKDEEEIDDEEEDE